MKKIITFGTFLLLISAVYLYKDTVVEKVQNISYFSLCENTIEYHIAFVDPLFGINKEEVIENVKKGAAIWNEQLNSQLFVYNPESSLDIHLNFDERQRQKNEISVQESTVEIEKFTLAEKVSDYEERYSKLDGAINELNEKVEYWNSQGGATPKVYSELIRQQKELNEQIADLNNIGNKIGDTTEVVNNQIDTLNSSINKFNDILDLLPEEGLYKPTENKIEIYFYDSEERFIHTAAHELGHALGMPHILQEKAIMHPTTSNNLELSDQDISELNNFCQEQNRFTFMKNNLELILNNKLKEFQTK